MDDDIEGQGNSASRHWQPLSHETGGQTGGNMRHVDIAAVGDGMSSAGDELVDIDDGDADEAIDMVAVRCDLSLSCLI
jgi:hypothetical protein